VEGPGAVAGAVEGEVEEKEQVIPFSVSRNRRGKFHGRTSRVMTSRKCNIVILHPIGHATHHTLLIAHFMLQFTCCIHTSTTRVAAFVSAASKAFIPARKVGTGMPVDCWAHCKG
jgi:hypothetical protein